MFLHVLVLFWIFQIKNISGFTKHRSPTTLTKGYKRSSMTSDHYFYDKLMTAVDKSVLGLLKPFTSDTFDAVNNAVILALTDLKTGTASAYSTLPIRFPAFEANVRQFIEFVESFHLDESSILTTSELTGWISYLDITHYPILPDSLKEVLLAQPALFRVGIGLIALELIPAYLNVLIFNSLRNVDVSNVDLTGLPMKYDKIKIAKYFASKPDLVQNRIFDIFVKSKDLILGLFSDKLRDNWDESRPERARQLRELLTALGPTYIKVGQALSVRPDIFEPEYLAELGKLQDQVPPFDSATALKILQDQLQVPPSSVFADLAAFEKPIAAASLGQVYKVQLKTGETVAVKVQRPNMLLTVSLDLFVIRSLFVLGTQIPDISEECSSFVGVVDNWAGRFLDELDYVTEAENSERFRMQMADKTTTLGDAIVVPKVYKQYSSEKMLISEWIEGTKLSAINTNTEEGRITVRKLTRVLLNSYLVQLLETGFLHADPHPGNFKVTSEGKLCILDFGLMTEVDEDKRFGLMEYVAHLLAKDYNATLDDLVLLEFVPKEVTDDVLKKAVVAPLLANILEQLSGGGGANAANLDKIGQDVDKLGEEYPIAIPPYFALVLRAFGALEGLGLSVDADYSIVQECFPYLARRLLSDDSPRIRTALRTFLYGSEGRLNLRRVDELATGYRTFTSTAADAASGKAFAELRLPSASSPLATDASTSTYTSTDPTVAAAVRILFSTQGNYVQELMLEELVRIADALSRSVSMTVLKSVRSPLSVLQNLRINPAQALPSSSSRGGVPADGGSDGGPLERVLGVTAEDLEALRTLKRLLQILANVERSESQKSHSSGVLDSEDLILVRQVLKRLAVTDLVGGSPDQARQRLQSIAPLLRDMAPGLASLGVRFGRRFAGRSLTRIADQLSASDKTTGLLTSK